MCLCVCLLFYLLAVSDVEPVGDIMGLFPGLFLSDMEAGRPFGLTLRCLVVTEAMGRLFLKYKIMLQLTASL